LHRENFRKDIAVELSQQLRNISIAFQKLEINEKFFHPDKLWKSLSNN